MQGDDVKFRAATQASGNKPADRASSGLASHVTSLEMACCSITVCAADVAMLELWDAPAHTATLRWGM
jgi:dihydroxyacetone kinase-like protein